MTVEELGDYIKENWNSISEQIRYREYKLMPVKKVEIPKPNGIAGSSESPREWEAKR